MTTQRKNAGLAGGSLLAAGLLLAAGFAGCKAAPPAAQTPVANSAAGDPADANLAPLTNDPGAVYSSSGSATGPATSPVRQPARVLGQRSEAQPGQASGETYAPQPQGSNEAYNYNQPPQQEDPNQYYEDAGAQALDDSDPNGQALYADQAPPPLPQYEQPVLTEANDQWTPGYWNYGNGGYFWVPGAWVAPPQPGYLWTPGYWGYYGRRYRFHHGFWGVHIGFYGGIPYGFGYTGFGYQGGYWRGSNFFYNREVNRVNVNVVRNVYVHNVTVVNNTYVNNRVSFNGPGGSTARPRPQELAAYNERRFAAMQNQVANVRAAEGNRQQFFAANQGRPAVAVAQERIAADRTLAQPLRPNAFAQQALAHQQAQAQQQRLGQQQHAIQPQRQGRPGVAAPGQAQNLRQTPQTRTPEQQSHPLPQQQQVQQQQRNQQAAQQQNARQPEAQQRAVPQSHMEQRTVQKAAPQRAQSQPPAKRSSQPHPPVPAQQPQVQRTQPQPQRASPQPPAQRQPEPQRPEPQRQEPQHQQTPAQQPHPAAPAAAPRPQAPAPQPRPQPAAAPRAAAAPEPHAEGGHPRR